MVESLNNMGVAYTAENNYPEAERSFSDALIILAKQSKPNSLALARVYTNMSGLYGRERKQKKAREMAQKAKKMRDLEDL